MTVPGKSVVVELWRRAAAWRYVVIGACACTFLAFVFPPGQSRGRSSKVEGSTGVSAAPPSPTGQADAPGSSPTTEGAATTTSPSPDASDEVGHAAPDIKPGARTEGVEETVSAVRQQAEQLVGAMKAETPGRGTITPNHSSALGAHRTKPSAHVEDADRVPRSPEP